MIRAAQFYVLIILSAFLNPSFPGGLDDLFSANKIDAAREELKKQQLVISNNERIKKILAKCSSEMSLSTKLKEQLARELEVNPSRIYIGSFQSTQTSCHISIYHPRGVCESTVNDFYAHTQIITSISGCNTYFN